MTISALKAVETAEAQVRQAELQIARLQGETDTLLARLQAEFGVATLKEAETLKAKLEANVQESEVQLTTDLETLTKIMEGLSHG